MNQEQDEITLRESEARYRRITEGLTDYLYTVRIENGQAVGTTQSPACEKVTGYTPEEFSANPYLWIEMVFTEDRDLVRERVNQLLAGIEIPPVEHRIIRKDGQLRWVKDTTILYKSTSGELLSYDGIIQDISERKRAEERIAQRIAALTLPVDSGKISFTELFDLDDIQRLQDEFSAATGVASLITLPDGTPLTTPSNFTTLCSDIIRKTEKGCMNCMKSDAALGRYHPDGPIVQPCLSGGLWDAGTSITVGGHHIASWLVGQVRDSAQTDDKMREYAREIGVDEEQLMEAFLKVPAMSREHFERIANVLFTLSNQLSTTAYQNIQQARFISERQQAEEERLSLERQLLQAQKMESLGVLAGGIAHDFNNILTSIVGNIELAIMRLNPESPALENLHRIEKGALRATDLAKQMLAYSGKGKFVVEAIDINRLIEEMVHMLEVSISKKALLRYNLAAPLPSVEVDATQIRQIIMNLVINASEAIGDKSGIISISTGCIACDVNYLRNVWLNNDIPEGLYVFLEIADTGCGMDKETLPRIFDPFFTTKFTGRGLGMAAVQGIVRGHKGAINVYSEAGRGSSFKVLLPAGEKPVELFDAQPDDAGFKGDGTILLVDDEETIRAIGSEMLRELGYTVITANDGCEAVELFKAHPGLYCVILDLTMPHLDGEQTFRELRMLDPEVRVIMSSGYSEYEVSQKFAGKGLAGFIQKPYKMSVLRDAIQKLHVFEETHV